MVYGRNVMPGFGVAIAAALLRMFRRLAVLTNGHSLPFTMTSRDFLDVAECAETLRRVNRLQDHWSTRSDFGFFSLGAASYLDAPESRDAYLAAAAQTNPILSEVFDDLYGALRRFLEYVLNEPVAYDEQLALPGFHIFYFDGSEVDDDLVAGRAHFDLQFGFVFPELRPEATLSFTLPLGLPSGGAGLAVWPIRYEEALRCGLSVRDLAVQSRCERMPYATGRMMLHDGFLLHAIGASSDSAPDGQRITLQGHGVRRQGRWTIYW